MRPSCDGLKRGLSARPEPPCRGGIEVQPGEQKVGVGELRIDSRFAFFRRQLAAFEDLVIEHAREAA